MAAGQVSRIPAQRELAAPPHSGLGVSSVLGSMGAVFSFFLIAEVEFIVIALPLAAAGMAVGLAHLQRVRAGKASDKAATALGLALSALGVAFCVAGLTVASVT